MERYSLNNNVCDCQHVVDSGRCNGGISQVSIRRYILIRRKPSLTFYKRINYIENEAMLQ